MAATTGYQAGLETTNTQVSYAVESVWGTLPTVQFQAIRYQGETLADSKTRTRPSEIVSTGEVPGAVTTQEQAGGDINYALSYGTFDDFLSGALNNDWQALQAIAGVAGDITFTAGTNVLSSTTAGKFTNISAGQWIRTLGFTNAANNGFWRVSAKADSQHLTLVGTTTVVTETPALAAAQVRASMLTNGTQFKSFYLQQAFSTSVFLRYPGAYISGFTLTGGIGQYFQGKFTFMAQQEMNATTNASTGSVLPAPAGKVHDPINGFAGMLLNEAAVSAVVDSFTITAAMKGAGFEFGMGTTLAQGMIMGLLEVTGSVKMFFKDFTLYSRFKAESTGSLEFITRDPSGNAYVITIQNAALMNPDVAAGGPGQPVYVTFQIEGNPLAASTGGTIQIDRLAAT